MNKLFDLSGKTAIVTGGAGSLGEAMAVALGQFGANVVVTGRTQKTLDEAVKHIEATGANAKAIVCDVTKEADCDKLVEETLKDFNTIDILITAAGIARRHPAEVFPADDFKMVIDANINGTFFPCKAVGNVMIEQKHGKIVTVSSVRGNNGHPLGYGAYAASKAAVIGLTRQLSSEWAKYNICVNAIGPTIVRSYLTEEVFADPAKSKIFLDRIPMGRPALADDMIGTIIYLCAPASDFITGQIIYIDGGCTAG